MKSLKEIIFRKIPHKHIWEFRCDRGEHHHGKNTTKRYCKLCNLEQYRHLDRQTDETWWEDSAYERLQRIKFI